MLKCFNKENLQFKLDTWEDDSIIINNIVYVYLLSLPQCNEIIIQ